MSQNLNNLCPLCQIEHSALISCEVHKKIFLDQSDDKIAVKTCTWIKKEKSSRWWKTGCGESWMLEEWETPVVARMKFCPICGKSLVTDTN